MAASTLNRHGSLLTITVTDDPHGNVRYRATVWRNAASEGEVVIASMAEALVWRVKGGQHGVGATGA